MVFSCRRTAWRTAPPLWWIRKGKLCISRRAPPPSTPQGPILPAAGRRIRNSKRALSGHNLGNRAAARFLRRVHLANLQYQRRSALPTNQRAVIQHVNRVGTARGAFRGWVGSIRQRIGRHGALNHSAFSCGLGLEGRSAGSANVVVAAIRRAGIKHLVRTAHRTRKFQFARPHATSFPG
jgi:hypothetical protein